MKGLLQKINSYDHQEKELAKELEALTASFRNDHEAVNDSELKLFKAIKKLKDSLREVKGVKAPLKQLAGMAADQGLEFFEANKVDNYYRVSFLDRDKKVLQVYNTQYNSVEVESYTNY